MNKISKILLWLPTLIIIIFFTLISLISISEWWNIKINKEVDKYSWGPINENSWFYETPNLYAIVQLIEGTIMIVLLIMSIKEIIKTKNKFNYWISLCFIFLIIMFISSNIK